MEQMLMLIVLASLMLSRNKGTHGKITEYVRVAVRSLQESRWFQSRGQYSLSTVVRRVKPRLEPKCAALNY